uniref:Dynein axonemal intermediate chain 3 n=1 Tax=Labrus bergylta TaxID=56723 RepID=A0A3Q3FCA5_9LABR
ESKYATKETSKCKKAVCLPTFLSVLIVISLPKGHPDDIFPMVLTSATQKLFGCLADEDVTGESPYKLLKKDDIIQDIKTRAAVSDFSPVKQTVLDYPEDEILLVFDRDFTYDQCFYLALTPEAKKRILNPPEPETPEVLENEVNKTPEPRKWIPQGSEQEVEKESVKETREKLCFKCSIVRRKFGAPVCFSDRNAADTKDAFLECPSYEDSRFSIKQMQRDCGIQAVPKLWSSSAQTQWYVLNNKSTQYMPREQSDEERESILKSKSLKNFLNSVTPRVLHALQQTEIMNVFIDDWKALGAGNDDSDFFGQVSEGLMLFRALSDQMHTKNKKISCVNWHPTIYGIIAVALTEKKKEQLNESTKVDVRPSLIIFYSFSDTSGPQLLLECPDDIFAFEFCPSDPNIVVGGCINGQVVLWDISAHVTHLQGTQAGGKKSSINPDTFDLDDNKEKKTPIVCYCAVSSIESGLKAPITDVQWLPPTFEVTRTGLAVENKSNLSIQVVTCSPEGSIMFWDVRATKLSRHSASGKKQKADQKSQMAPFSVPDTFKHLDQTWKPLFRDGEIVYADWKLLKDDSGRLNSEKPLHCSSIHHWIVNTVQRSPFFKDIILTVGAWDFAIWREGVMGGPIIQSPSSEQVYTVGCWSLSRPAVFFLGKEDGSIEVWNLLAKTGAPVQVYAHVTKAKITCIKPWTASTCKFTASVVPNLESISMKHYLFYYVVVLLCYTTESNIRTCLTKCKSFGAE